MEDKELLIKCRVVSKVKCLVNRPNESGRVQYLLVNTGSSCNKGAIITFVVGSIIRSVLGGSSWGYNK